MKRAKTNTRRSRRTREPWGPQISELRRAVKAQVPAKKIARQLGRTEAAVRQKVFSLGLSLRARKRA
jgi:hypothetical protein